MKKIIAVLQIVFGSLGVYLAGFLAYKKRPVDNFSHLAPNNVLEIFLIVISLLIFLLAVSQRAKNARFASWQFMLGLGATILSLVLFASTNLVATYAYPSEVYWLIFLLIAAIVLVVITGIIQLFSRT